MKTIEIKEFIRENKNFDLLWSSQILSQITTSMMTFVMATRIYEKTHSALAVSFLWVFYYLPCLLLGPFSGLLVDLWDLRNTVLYTNLFQGLVMLLFLFVKDQIYLIYPIVFLYSFLNQFYLPAEGSFLLSLVKKQELPLANGLFLLTTQGSLVFGVGLGGLLIRFFGKNNPVIITSSCLFMAALSVYFLPKIEKKRKINVDDLANFWKGMKAGYLFIRDNRIVLFPILFMSFLQIFLITLIVAIPSFANNVLKIQVQDAGPLLFIPLALGAIAGIYLMSKKNKNLRKKDLMKKGMLGAFIVFMFFSLFLPFLGSLRVLLAMVLMFFLGTSGIYIFVPNQTLIQEHTPPQLRGRVLSAWAFFNTALTLPFLLFSATIVDSLGVGLFMFSAGIIILALRILAEKFEPLILGVNNGNQ